MKIVNSTILCKYNYLELQMKIEQILTEQHSPSFDLIKTLAILYSKVFLSLTTLLT